jgi:hypothetical protein
MKITGGLGKPLLILIAVVGWLGLALSSPICCQVAWLPAGVLRVFGLAGCGFAVVLRNGALLLALF